MTGSTTSPSRAAADDPIFADLLAASEQLDLVTSFVEVDSATGCTSALPISAAAAWSTCTRKDLFTHLRSVQQSRHFTPAGRRGLRHPLPAAWGCSSAKTWHASLCPVLWRDGADIPHPHLGVPAEHGQARR